MNTRGFNLFIAIVCVLMLGLIGTALYFGRARTGRSKAQR